MNKIRCINLTTHFNIQNKSLRTLFSEYNRINTLVNDHINNYQNSNSLDITLIPRQLRHLNETIVRICSEFASTRDLVNIYHIFSKSHLYKLIESNTGHSTKEANDLINQISKEANLKFTLFSLEQQCLKLSPVVYPYQIAILLSSHLRMGRCNEIFITELLNSFARLNESKVRIPFYNPNTLSLMVHIITTCMKKGINTHLLDNIIDFILIESKNCANKFTPLDTVTLTYSLLKYGLEINKISNILLLILTNGSYNIELLRTSIGKFEDLQHLSLLTNVTSCCFPIKNASIMDKNEFDFRINLWSILLSRYFTLLSQYKMDGIDLSNYKILDKIGITLKVENPVLEVNMQLCEKLTNSLVSLSKAFELDLSTDTIRLTKCGITKSKLIIYRIYRSINIDLSESTHIDIDDLFYSTYAQLFILADIICKLIKSQCMKAISPLTISNSIHALSRLHIQQYDYFNTIGDYISKDSNLIRFSQNCIALICNSFADCRFQHPSIFPLLSRFITINTRPNPIDFYHVLITLRKFGIYSHTATRWIIETCDKTYLDELSSQGLISLLSYLMTYNFYHQPIGFILTHYLAIKIGQLIPDKRNYELNSQYKICSLIYHTFDPHYLDSWLNSEVEDQVSANWLKTKAYDLLHKSLFINSTGFNNPGNRSNTNPSTFASDVANVIKDLGYMVKLEYDKDPYYIDILLSKS